ncbi:MAG: 30S ribosomal protein S2 [Planctomycetota bacterium]|nr:30S ribosomal protein S2 [Planctomycetota bacterium]
MAIVDVKEIIAAGVHFGHRASRWHPKMKPYIFGKRNLIHIVDVRETIRGLVRASNFLTRLVASGREVVLIGTKRQAKSLIMQEAERAGMHWVSERWLGGTLTNFHTVRSRLKRLEELEGLEADGSIEEYSKKRISAFRRERRKILRNLEGLRHMKQLPGALIVVDIRREYISVREARKTNIPVVALVDTDCNPEDVDIAIPGNDDSYRSIQIVLRTLADAVILGRKNYEATQAELEKERAGEAERERERAAAKKEAAGAKAARPAPATLSGDGGGGGEDTPSSSAPEAAPASG